MGISIPDALRIRHRQSAIVSTLAISIMRSMQRAYHSKNLGQLMERYAIACTVRINDDVGGEPMTIAALAKMWGWPRSNTERAADALVEQGMLKKDGHAFVGDLDFLTERADAEYFTDVCQAILKAADALRETGIVAALLLMVS